MTQELATRQELPKLEWLLKWLLTISEVEMLEIHLVGNQGRVNILRVVTVLE